MMQLFGLLFFALLAASVLLSLASLVAAWRGRVWQTFGLWGLGLGAGVMEVPVTLARWNVEAANRAADRLAGRPVVLNDMQGFSEALLGVFGLMYFAGVLVLVLLLLALHGFQSQKAR